MYYVIRVSTNKEKDRITSIKQNMDNSLFKEIFVPQRKKLQKYATGWKEKEYILFPGYIFVDTEDPVKFYLALKPLPGFKMILTFGEGKDKYFFPLSKIESDNLDKLCGKSKEKTVEISSIGFDVNNNIKVVDGPLQGFKGKIVRMNLHKREVTVLMDMVGRETEVTLSVRLIRNADEHK